jgi:hypothetical protein
MRTSECRLQPTRSSHPSASLTGLGPARAAAAAAARVGVSSRHPSSLSDSCHSGGARVHPAPLDATPGSSGVPAVVVDDVGAGVADLARRGEHAQVVALDEDRALAAQQAVEALGDPDAEALEGARELPGAVGFDGEVQVVALDGPVDDAGARAAAGRHEGAANDLAAILGAQARDVAVDLEGNVSRVAAGQGRTLAVERFLVPALGRLAAGPRAASDLGPPRPGAEGHDKLLGFLHRAVQVEYGQILKRGSDNFPAPGPEGV